MLVATHLVGFGAGASGPNNGPYGRTVLTKQTNTANQSSYTFTDVALGTAYDDRLIVLAITSVSFGDLANPASDTALTSISVGGVSGTIADQRHFRAGGGRFSLAAITYAVVPSGATGDIVVTFERAIANVIVQPYAITGIASATPVAANGSGSNTDATSRSTTVNVNANGIVIGALAGGGGATATWTGATEDHDGGLETSLQSAASQQGLSAETPRTVSATFGNCDTNVLSVASWA